MQRGGGHFARGARLLGGLTHPLSAGADCLPLVRLEVHLPHFDLTDRVAIVSGGSDGIGKGIALAMAAAGAHIVVAARRKREIAAASASVARNRG